MMVADNGTAARLYLRQHCFTVGTDQLTKFRLKLSLELQLAVAVLHLLILFAFNSFRLCLCGKSGLVLAQISAHTLTHTDGSEWRCCHNLRDHKLFSDRAVSPVLDPRSAVTGGHTGAVGSRSYQAQTSHVPQFPEPHSLN